MHHCYSYTEFLSDCATLTERINWEFDAIVAIPRGGLTLAHLLREYYTITRSLYDQYHQLRPLYRPFSALVISFRLTPHLRVNPSAA